MTTGIYPNPVHSSNVLGKIDHQFSGADQLSVRYALYDVTSDNARGVGNLNAPSGSTGLDNRRPVDRDQQRLDDLLEYGQRNPRADRPRRPEGVFDRSDRPPGHDLRCRDLRHLLGQPTRRENTLYQAVSNLSHSAGAHALRAGVDFLLNDDTITFLRTFRGSYTFSSLGNFLTGNYNGFAQTFGDPVVNQKNPNVGVYAQDEWRASSRLTLNGGVRYDLQFLETINTDTNNVSPRAGFVWAPTASQRLPGPRRGGCLLRPGAAARRGECALVSRQHDGRHAAAPAAGVGHPADAGRRSGLSQYPAGPSAVHGPRVDHDDGQGPAECVLEAGEHRDRANARRQPHHQRRVSVFPRREPADVDQPERADVRGGGHEQRVPAGVGLHEQQPVSRRRRLELSRPARDLPAASEELVRRSRQLRAVEVHERSRRGVLQLADRPHERDEGLGALRQ